MLLLTACLETSENDDDVFADASEGQGPNSGPESPIPTTRVEKVTSLSAEADSTATDYNIRSTIGRITVKSPARRHTE